VSAAEPVLKRRAFAAIVRQFKGVRVLVVGDAIIDHYHFGRIDRISPEAPVPIFVEDPTKVQMRRGGADNVAHQLEALGCTVTTVFSPRRSVKHRYLVGHYQVFRIDEDACGPDTDMPSFRDGTFDVVVVSDYGKGFLSPLLCRRVMRFATQAAIPVVVDPKGPDWGKYRDATVVCPNQREFDQWNRQSTPDNLILKRGEQGLDVIEYVKGRTPEDCHHVPAQARQVYDVTGAGDVVVALVAAALGVGCDLKHAARLATVAAGYAVGEVGTTVCPAEKLIELVTCLLT
jgi:D-beta-D-heptose 7-phosphate kinase/D-beta-D-heptose 1-phosphate adenosyltransferase